MDKEWVAIPGKENEYRGVYMDGSNGVLNKYVDGVCGSNV